MPVLQSDFLGAAFVLILIIALAMACILGLITILDAIMDGVTWCIKSVVALCNKSKEEVLPELSPVVDDREWAASLGLTEEEPPYNVIDGYVLPTQEDMDSVVVNYDCVVGVFDFTVGDELFEVYEHNENFNEGDTYFNGVFVGTSEEYINAVFEVYENQAAAELSRLTRIDDKETV